MKFAFQAATKRGFTLIELLVVIAIIGILSSVVLASLNTARSRGTDAKIQSELRSIAVNAELYYDTSGNYGSAASGASGCTTSGTMFQTETPTNIKQIVASLNGVGTAGSLVCQSNGTAYAVSKQLVSDSGKYFCIDSTGKATTTASSLGSSSYTCE